jgi:hypothetical protein
VADQGGRALWAGATGPALHKANFLRVATVVTNVETALRIYLTMMVSLRSRDLSTLANSFVSGNARKDPFLQSILVETLFVNGTILVIKFL